MKEDTKKEPHKKKKTGTTLPGEKRVPSKAMGQPGSEQTTPAKQRKKRERIEKELKANHGRNTHDSQQDDASKRYRAILTQSQRQVSRKRLDQNRQE